MGTSEPVALRAIAATRDHTAALAAADTAIHQAAVDLADTRATLRDLTTIRREDTPA